MPTITPSRKLPSCKLPSRKPLCGRPSSRGPTRKTLLHAALCLATGIVCVVAPPLSRGADAEPAWPAHPVRILVGSPPGQAVDIIGRVLAEDFSKAFGQQFFVDNRVGAGGMLSTAIGAKAAPDGYTLIIASSGPMVMTPAINSKVPYDPVRSFAPIANVALTPQTMIVGAASPFKTVADVIAAARARPGILNYSSVGIGSTGHLAMEVLQGAAGIRLNHVPFKGNQEAATSLVSGDVAVGFDTVPGSMTMIRGGRLRALALAGPKRSPYLPDVPTFAEAGFPAVNAVGWVGLAAPAGTPVAVLDKLNKQIAASLASPAVKERFAVLALVPVGDSREQFASFIASERTRWAQIAKDAGVKEE